MEVKFEPNSEYDDRIIKIKSKINKKSNAYSIGK